MPNRVPDFAPGSPVSYALLAKETVMKRLTFWLFFMVILQAASWGASTAAQERLTVEIVKFSCRQLPPDVTPKNMPDKDVDAVTSQRYRNNQNIPSSEVDMGKIEAEKYEGAQSQAAEGVKRAKD